MLTPTSMNTRFLSKVDAAMREAARASLRDGFFGCAYVGNRRGRVVLRVAHRRFPAQGFEFSYLEQDQPSPVDDLVLVALRKSPGPEAIQALYTPPATGV